MAIPFYLSYMLEVTQTFELSKDAMENLAASMSYRLFVGLFVMLLIINFLRKIKWHAGEKDVGYSNGCNVDILVITFRSNSYSTRYKKSWIICQNTGKQGFDV